MLVISWLLPYSKPYLNSEIRQMSEIFAKQLPKKCWMWNGMGDLMFEKSEPKEPSIVVMCNGYEVTCLSIDENEKITMTRRFEPDENAAYWIFACWVFFNETLPEIMTDKTPDE